MGCGVKRGGNGWVGILPVVFLVCHQIEGDNSRHFVSRFVLFLGVGTLPVVLLTFHQGEEPKRDHRNKLGIVTEFPNV